jgi:hypothetical protein
MSNRSDSIDFENERDFDSPPDNSIDVRTFDSPEQPPVEIYDQVDTNLPATAADNNQQVSINPLAMVQQAIDKGLPVETLERLMSLQERFEKNSAKKSFDKAFASFMKELPNIEKNKNVHYETKKGVTDYNHTTLDYAIAKIAPVLSKHGLSYHWETKQSEQTSVISVTCFISHIDGHQRSTTMSAEPDISGGKNPVQGIGSTTSYLKRYTLFLLLGLASAEDDTDGRDPYFDELIDEEQVEAVKSIIKEKGRTIESAEKFIYKYFGFGKIEAITKNRFDEVIRSLK